MNNIINIINITLGIIAILGLGFSIWKIIWPKVKINIISFYPTITKEKKLTCILKISVESSIDLIIEQFEVALRLGLGIGGGEVDHNTSDHFIKLKLFPIRYKGCIFKMRDFKNREKDYKLLKSIDPYRIFQQIMKSGINYCYIALQSEGDFQYVPNVPNVPIKKWKFEITVRSPLFFVPIWVLRKKKHVFEVNHPEDQDLYFDDDLLQKISEKEKEEQLEQL